MELYTEDEDGDEVLLDTVLAFYMKNLPSVDKPERPGYDFMGFYDRNGQQYYTADMKGLIWDKASSGELYAEWEVHEYEVTLQYTNEYGTYVFETLYVAYGEIMPEVTYKYAPLKTGYAFLGFYEKQNGQGKKYYNMQVQQNPADEYFEMVVTIPNVKWDKYADATLYAHWEILECDYVSENIIEGIGNLESTTYHIIHDTPKTIQAREFDGYTFKYFWREGREYTGTCYSWSFRLKRDPYTNTITIINGGFFAVYTKNDSGGTCVAAGTMITLADGRQVPVETLTGNEMLLVWNLQTGKFDVAPMVFVDSEPAALYKVINLYFSDGTQMKVISEHGFWDLNLNRYVYLREDAAKYIGHWFSKQGTNGLEKVQLINVVVQEEYTTAWSPVTYGHLCYFVNGMLSMPGGIDGLFNIFEVNPEKEVMDLILSNLSYALTGENDVLDSYAIERQMETIKGEIDDSIELLEKTEGDKGRIEQMIEQQTNALAALREQLKLVRTKMESNEKVHAEIERISNLLTDESLCFDIYDDRTVRLLVEYIRVQGDGSIVIMLKGGITIEEKVI